MKFEDIEPGQKVRVVTKNPKYRTVGTVRAKEIISAGGRNIERVYVDTERGRRLCVPSVLEQA